MAPARDIGSRDSPSPILSPRIRHFVFILDSIVMSGCEREGVQHLFYFLFLDNTHKSQINPVKNRERGEESPE